MMSDDEPKGLSVVATQSMNGSPIFTGLRLDGAPNDVGWPETAEDADTIRALWSTGAVQWMRGASSAPFPDGAVWVELAYWLADRRLAVPKWAEAPASVQKPLNRNVPDVVSERMLGASGAFVNVERNLTLSVADEGPERDARVDAVAELLGFRHDVLELVSELSDDVEEKEVAITLRDLADRIERDDWPQE